MWHHRNKQAPLPPSQTKGRHRHQQDQSRFSQSSFLKRFLDLFVTLGYCWSRCGRHCLVILHQVNLVRCCTVTAFILLAPHASCFKLVVHACDLALLPWRRLASTSNAAINSVLDPFLDGFQSADQLFCVIMVQLPAQ